MRLRAIARYIIPSPSEREELEDLTQLNPGSSVVVPVYNSAACLPGLIAALEAVLRRLAERYEVVLVNDGSRDQSWEVVRELQAGRPWLRGIDLMRNYGNTTRCSAVSEPHATTWS